MTVWGRQNYKDRNWLSGWGNWIQGKREHFRHLDCDDSYIALYLSKLIKSTYGKWNGGIKSYDHKLDLKINFYKINRTNITLWNLDKWTQA